MQTGFILLSERKSSPFDLGSLPQGGLYQIDAPLCQLGAHESYHLPGGA